MANPKQSESYLFQFAVISDSHIRLPNATREGGYASNRLSIARAKYVVDCVNNLHPDFVVHLGDLVHPIPALGIHEETVKLAREIFSDIEAKFYALPGNHDIGDKPNAWLPAPVVEAASHRVFSKYWGPLYQSFSIETCHFICLDTPIMNAGFDREHEQRIWLENELHFAREKDLRIFIFMHYPLFICDPNEPTHYDNIDQPARSWLLELFKRYSVQAVFSGHVHNVFVGVYENTIYYSLPSTAFVRPEYSELATVGPGDEFGRNDRAKLGFYFVRVYADRHEILPVRTYGAGKLDARMPQVDPNQMVAETVGMLGVTLRRGWGRRVELAADGLDEFRRKEAYRDGLLMALFELGVTSLRVPFADLANADVRLRLSDFVKLGFEFTVFSLGIPDASTLDALEVHGHLIVNWEIIFPEHAVSQIGPAIQSARSVFPGQLFIAPVVPIKEIDGDGISFQHFASHGFSSSQAEKSAYWLSMIDHQIDDIGLTFRVSPWDQPNAALHDIDQHSVPAKLINLQLPRLDEGECFDDDQKLASFLVDAYNASRVMVNTTVFIDTFIDSDRGYYPRIGIVDRRFNPRPAFYALKLAALVR
jgi:3',5'-cyclic AMP phosphodiesterase CpdA